MSEEYVPTTAYAPGEDTGGHPFAYVEAAHIAEGVES